MTGYFRFVAAPLLAILLASGAPARVAADPFAIPPERAQDLLLELLRDFSGGDRDDALLRLETLARLLRAESRGATADGRRELATALDELATLAGRVNRRVAVSRQDLLAVCVSVQEGLAYHYRGQAEIFRQRGLAADAARARHHARLSENHARRFRPGEPEKVSRQFTGAGNRLARNAGEGLADLFRGVSRTVARTSGARGLAEPKPKREPPEDPWR